MADAVCQHQEANKIFTTCTRDFVLYIKLPAR